MLLLGTNQGKHVVGVKEANDFSGNGITGLGTQRKAGDVDLTP